MSENANRKRQFRCQYCNGLIVIPWDLPPTKGPCPHCGKEIISPVPPSAADTGASKMPTPMPSAPEEPKPEPQSSPAASRPESSAPAPKPVSAAPMPSLGSEDREALSERPPTSLPVSAAVPLAPEPEDVHRLEPVPEPEKAARAPERRRTPERGGPRREERGEIPDLRERPVLEERRESKAKGHGRLVAGLVALLLLALALAAAIWVARDHFNPAAPKPDRKTKDTRKAEIQRERYLEIGWREDARKVLEKFIAARTVEEKALYSIGGTALLPEMTEFYGTGEIDDSDTPASAFSYYDLRREDRERGMFLMIYDLPPGFELSEFFRPLATMEVQYGIESPDMLLASFARAENFVREPVRVQAFFKETPDGLKVDWHVFVQTKFRLFRSFLDNPVPGRREVFRLLVSEDVAEGGRSKEGTRTYRLDDPIHGGDSARVEVPVDSEIGRILSKVNWRGRKAERPAAKTATMELAWRGDDDPQIEISRFICWEFLGLGGKPGNDPPDTPPTAKETADK